MRQSITIGVAWWVSANRNDALRRGRYSWRARPSWWRRLTQDTGRRRSIHEGQWRYPEQLNAEDSSRWKDRKSDKVKEHQKRFPFLWLVIYGVRGPQEEWPPRRTVSSWHKCSPEVEVVSGGHLLSPDSFYAALAVLLPGGQMGWTNEAIHLATRNHSPTNSSGVACWDNGLLAINLNSDTFIIIFYELYRIMFVQMKNLSFRSIDIKKIEHNFHSVSQKGYIIPLRVDTEYIIIWSELVVFHSWSGKLAVFCRLCNYHY